jgi:hypothetical protein
MKKRDYLEESYCKKSRKKEKRGRRRILGFRKYQSTTKIGHQELLVRMGFKGKTRKEKIF